MRDLFSHCTCVRMYVHKYVLVTLRNVNLRSCSECQVALTPRQDIGYIHYMMASGRFLATEKGEDSAACPSNIHILRSQVHKQILNVADSWQLWEKKAKKSAHTVETKRATEERERVFRSGNEAEGINSYSIWIYPRSGNFRCKNIFVVCINHENKKPEIYY